LFSSFTLFALTLSASSCLDGFSWATESIHSFIQSFSFFPSQSSLGLTTVVLAHPDRYRLSNPEAGLVIARTKTLTWTSSSIPITHSHLQVNHHTWLVDCQNQPQAAGLLTGSLTFPQRLQKLEPIAPGFHLSKALV
jgi:hypothetical protein